MLWKPLTALQMEKLTPGGSFTGFKQWWSPRHLFAPTSSTPGRSCFLTVHVQWTTNLSLVYVRCLVENTVSGWNLSFSAFFPVFFFFYFFFLLFPLFYFIFSDAFSKCWESQLIDSAQAHPSPPVLISDSCWELLCEGIARLPCLLDPQPFFLNCQQHQLVPHVVWVCTVAIVAKSLKCGQNANWPIDKFLGVSLGEKVWGRQHKYKSFYSL